MMAGTETVAGGFKGSEAEPKLSSHQDLEEVGGICGGTRLDSVDGDGNGNGSGNVRNDLGGSYVFVRGAGEVNAYDPPFNENSNVESKSEVEVKVELEGGVVGNGENDQTSVVEEVVGNESIGVIENVELDCEVKVEDQVKSESSPVAGDEESQTKAGAGIGEGEETAIKLADAGELSDRIVGAVMENILVSTGESGEGKESKIAVLEAGGCELAKVESEIEVDLQEGISKEESEIKSIEESLESQIGIMGSVGCVSHELENDKNKSEKAKDSDSDIAGAVLSGNKIDAVDCERSMAVADKYNVSRDKDLEECIDDCQTVNNETNVTPSDVTSPKSAGKVPIERTENISDDTGDGAAIDHEPSRSVTLQGSGTVNLWDESSTDITTTSNADLDEALQSEERVKCINRSHSAELIGIFPAKTCGSGLAGPVSGTVSDQTPVDAKCQCGLFQGCGAEKVLKSSDGTLTTVTGTSPASDQTKILQINPGEGIRGCTNSADLNANPDYVQSSCIGLQVQSDRSVQFDSMGSTIAEGEVGSLVSPITESISELKNEDLISEDVESAPFCITDGTESVTEIPNGLSSLPPNVVRSQTRIEFGSIDSAELGSTSSGDHVLFKSQVLNGDRKCTCKKTANNLDQRTHTTSSVESGSSADVSLKSDVQRPSAISSSDEPGKDATGAESEVRSGSVVKDGHASSLEGSISDSVDVQNPGDVSLKSDGQHPSASSSSLEPGKDATGAESEFLSESVVNGCASSPEGSIDDLVNVQNLGAAAKTKPFFFLIKFPRFDEDKVRQQIRDAQLLVEEKTIGRDDIRNKIEIKRNNLQSLGDKFEASRSNERAARRLVKLKRQEIDSLQAKFTRVKNSIAVMDITSRIEQMEYIMEHETQPLKDEMQMLREINQLKKLRDQISSNVCSMEEAPKAFSLIEPIEMQLKALKKGLGDLKDQVSKAEEAVILLGKGYNDESKRLRELQAQFRAANDVRQHAYKHLIGLKNQLHEKSKHYWLYKNDAKAANDFVLNGDREALHCLCTNQVESVMDLWNKDDEFRKDYVRSNMRSTVRRLKTLDGRALGPDEEAPVIPGYVDKREDMQLSGPARTTSPSLVTISENSVRLVKSEPIDDDFLVKEELASQNSKTITSLRPVPSSGLTIGHDNFEANDTKEEEENQQTEEELELARKAEMLRQEEIALKLKEQRRQEEKAKAQEALERKRRNAEKAQLRAELRAQKEAEQKEKEREKRLRKKEKKNGDGAACQDLGAHSTKDESKDSLTTGAKTRKISQHSKYNKPKAAAIPPALRNRGKRRLKQFLWWLCATSIVVFLFFIGNGGGFKPHKVDKMFAGRRTWQPAV